MKINYKTLDYWSKDMLNFNICITMYVNICITIVCDVIQFEIRLNQAVLMNDQKVKTKAKISWEQK